MIDGLEVGRVEIDDHFRVVVVIEEKVEMATDDGLVQDEFIDLFFAADFSDSIMVQ